MNFGEHNSTHNRVFFDIYIKKTIFHFSRYKQEKVIGISPTCYRHWKGTHIILMRKMEEQVLAEKGRSQASLDAFCSLDTISFFFVQDTSFKGI